MTYHFATLEVRIYATGHKGYADLIRIYARVLAKENLEASCGVVTGVSYNET